MTEAKTLSDAQKKELSKHEKVIKKGIEAFLVTARALYAIRERKLYAPHESYTAYCVEKWEMTPNDSSRYWRAGYVLENLKDFDQLPENEAQARELVKLGDDRMRQVWQEVIDSGQKITAKLITEIAGLPDPTAKQTKKLPPPAKENTTLRLLHELATVLRIHQPQFADDLDGSQSRQLIAELRKLLNNIEAAIPSELKVAG